jgi:hypothetical protein
VARKRKSEAIAPEVVEQVEQADRFSDAAEAVDQTLVELATGIKIALKVRKASRVRGAVEEKIETTDDETWWVYTTPPSVTAAKLIREQIKGKAAAREAKATASSLVLKLAVPGHDREITRFLASLDPTVLARYDFDAETLAAIEAARE